MNRIIFQLSMLLLLFNNILVYNNARKQAKKNMYYFFVCYVFLYCLAIFIQSAFVIPPFLCWMILITLGIGSFRQGRVSKGLFIALYKFYSRFMKMVAKGTASTKELIGILLLYVFSKILNLLVRIRFDIVSIIRRFPVFQKLINI